MSCFVAFLFCFGFVTKTELISQKQDVQLFLIPYQQFTHFVCPGVYVCGKQFTYHGLHLGLNPRPVSLGDLRHVIFPL